MLPAKFWKTYKKIVCGEKTRKEACADEIGEVRREIGSSFIIERNIFTISLPFSCVSIILILFYVWSLPLHEQEDALCELNLWSKMKFNIITSSNKQHSYTFEEKKRAKCGQRLVGFEGVVGKLNCPAAMLAANFYNSCTNKRPKGQVSRELFGPSLKICFEVFYK